MATLVFTDAKIYAGDYDISGDSNQVSIAASYEGLDDTVFGDTFRSVKPGLASPEMSAAGLQDFDDEKVDEDLFGKLGGTQIPVGILPDGEDEGDVGYVFDAGIFSYTPLGNTIGELAKFEFTASARNSPLVRATALHAATRTATGNSTARQLGLVAEGQKLYAALFVFDVDGTSPTLDVLVRSDDNSGMTTATTRITFSQVTAKAGVWAVPISGAIADDDYWDIDFTITGSAGQTFRFIVFVGIQ